MEPNQYVDLFLLTEGKSGSDTQQSNAATTLFDFSIVNLNIFEANENHVGSIKGFYQLPLTPLCDQVKNRFYFTTS